MAASNERSPSDDPERKFPVTGRNGETINLTADEIMMSDYSDFPSIDELIDGYSDSVVTPPEQEPAADDSQVVKHENPDVPASEDGK